MTRVELNFYTVEEKEPPFDKDLLCKLKDGGFAIYTYHDDSEYGKCFSGFENYWRPDTVLEWAEL